MGGLHLQIWSANCRGNQNNCRYPNEQVVTDIDEMREAVSADHTFIRFKDDYRCRENFLSAKAVVFDCDNDHSGNSSEWITREQIAQAFPDVGFITYTSRNHMKQKGNRSPRPRFHVIFMIDEITDPDAYKELLEEVQDYFPYFDTNALDAGRFFYGFPDTKINVTEGSMNLSQFLSRDAFADMEKEIPEGNRNATMFRWAVRSMKRYGDTEEARERFYMEADKCTPPLGDAELKSIWKSAGKYYQKILDTPDYVSPEVYNGEIPAQWDTPIPFSSFTMPEFPIDALPPEIGRYAAAVAESTQTPPDMAAALAISMLSTCLQGKYCIRGKTDWIEPLNTYVLAIAPPSERKSAVQHAMVKPINDYEVMYNKMNAAAVESSKMQKRILERRQKMVEDQVAKGKAEMSELDSIAAEVAAFKEVRPLKMYVDDITTEKLVSVLSENNGRAALISTEGGIFDTLSGIYTKNVNIDVMLKGYSGDTIRVDRVGRDSECIMDPALTVLLMAQPNVVSEVLSNTTFRGRGLTARFLYCMPKSSVGARKFNSRVLDPRLEHEYEKCIRNLLDDEYPDKPEIITLSDEAFELLKQFAEELEPKLVGEYEDIADWVGKLVGNTLRISGLLCRATATRCNDFLEEPEPLVVSGKIMSDAIRIGRYFLFNARAAFEVLPEDAMYRKADMILAMIRSEKLDEFDRRTAMRNCRSFKKVSDIQPVLDFLEDYGYIFRKASTEPELKGRPPLPKYLVNPWVHQ